MKPRAFVFLLASVLPMPLSAEPAEAPVSTDPVITSRGPHHRVWTRTNIVTLPNARTHISSYVELGSGMHRWDPNVGQWVDAEVALEIQGNTAVSRNGAHNVAFAANANTPGATVLVSPDGKTFRSHVLGIAWFDANTSRSEMIAELKDSIGELQPPDTVIYRDAFDGLNAELRYVQRLGSFEQDVILRENPVLPEGYQPDSTRLEVWTEFIEYPGATLTQHARYGMTDDILDFGAMQTGHGRAFAIGEEGTARRSSPVAKRWFEINGRTFLVEAVRFKSVQAALERLPAHGQAAVKALNRNAQVAAAEPALNRKGEREGARGNPHFGDRPFPPAPQARAKAGAEKFRTAAIQQSPSGAGQGELRTSRVQTNASLEPKSSTLNFPNRGLVLDYVLQANLTSFVFQCDTTYYVSNTVNLYDSVSGGTAFEGGTVVKFAKTNIAQLNLNAAVTWLTSAYRQAVFTAIDDETLGEHIGSSTGSPTGYYGGVFLNFAANPGDPHDVRISYAATGMKDSSTYTPTIRHSQFVHCGTALYYDPGFTASATIENALFYDVGAVHDGFANLSCKHLTVHQCGKFSNTADPRNADVMNSLLIRMTNWGNVYTSLVSCVSGTDDSIFTTVGAAAHYLTPNSPYRDQGSALSGPLANDIKKRTTYPPIVLSNTIISTDTLFPAQAGRDTDTPDLGYHYAPIDFALGSVLLTNANITLSPGAAVASFAPTGGAYALFMRGGSTVTSEGMPTNLNHFARYNCVQEQANSNWTNPGSFFSLGNDSSASCRLSCRFTEFSCPASLNYDYYDFHIAATDLADANIALVDCQVQGGQVSSIRGAVAYTNSLFSRVRNLFVDFGYFDSFHFDTHESTFRGGYLEFVHFNAASWTVTNNLFDALQFVLYGSLVADYNGYTTNITNITSLGGASNVAYAATSPGFRIGSLGEFYLPTDSVFLNKGSTYATNVGLYHFTCTTNQWKETNSIVDIGFHYIALDSNGIPVDTDGDGVPDYVEDANGNGSVGGAESDWRTYTSRLGISGTVGLQVFTPLKK